VYCHEILQVKSLEELDANVVPDIPTQSKAISDEIQKVDFAKYCLKMGLEQVKHGFYWPCLFGNISMHRITRGPTAQ
jgi:hypothetical protein